MNEATSISPARLMNIESKTAVNVLCALGTHTGKLPTQHDHAARRKDAAAGFFSIPPLCPLCLRSNAVVTFDRNQNDGKRCSKGAFYPLKHLRFCDENLQITTKTYTPAKHNTLITKELRLWSRQINTLHSREAWDRVPTPPRSPLVCTRPNSYSRGGVSVVRQR